MSDPITAIVVDPLENVMDSLGMMDSPMKRVAFGAALGAAIAYGLKPGFAFDEKGLARPFAATATDVQKDQATWLPAWGIVALPAIILGVLI